MQSCHNSAHSAFIHWNSGIDNSLGKNAFFKEASTQFYCQCTLSNNHRGNRSLALTSIEAKLLQALLKEVGILPQTFNQSRITFQNVQCSNTGSNDGGRM